MRKSTAAVGSAVFFLLAPGVVAGLIPWWLTRWQVREPVPYWAPVRVLGGILILAGLIALVRAFVRFVVEGLGTPAPVAAPEHLVVGGVYRYVRNPMYVAVLAAIVGQALLLGRLGLLLYAGAPGCSSRRSSAGTRNLPSPAALARTTRPTGSRCPPGGPVCVPGNPASVTIQAQGDALAGNRHLVLVFPR
jgi:hypothetical protein